MVRTQIMAWLAEILFAYFLFMKICIILYLSNISLTKTFDLKVKSCIIYCIKTRKLKKELSLSQNPNLSEIMFFGSKRGHSRLVELHKRYKIGPPFWGRIREFIPRDSDWFLWDSEGGFSSTRLLYQKQSITDYFY